MDSTRASTMPSKPARPNRKDRQANLLRELEIDGTEALAAGGILAAGGRTRRRGRAEAEMGEGGDGEGEITPPPAKRLRGSKTHASTTISKRKRKVNVLEEDGDNQEVGDVIAVAHSPTAPPTKRARIPPARQAAKPAAGSKAPPTRRTRAKLRKAAAEAEELAPPNQARSSRAASKATSAAMPREGLRTRQPDLAQAGPSTLPRSVPPPPGTEADPFAFRYFQELEYLNKAKSELREQRKSLGKTISRARELDKVLPYLDQLKLPPRTFIAFDVEFDTEEAGVDEPIAYHLNPIQAKQLFRSYDRIVAPVFISNVAPSVTQPDDPREPIKQILDWFQNDNEPYEAEDLHLPMANADETPAHECYMGDVRDHFLNPPANRSLYPWNFPDLLNPLPTPCLPTFLHHPSCNFLRDLSHWLLDLHMADMCVPPCPGHGLTAERCKEHILTAEELLEIETSNIRWTSTIMLADPGAITLPHVDERGFGTIISVHQGEIGLAWLKRPETKAACAAALESPDADATWYFSILSLGMTVYLGPGTAHFAFRRPNAGPTLGTAPRVLRYCDAREWLSALVDELGRAIKSNDYTKRLDTLRVVRGLVLSFDVLYKALRGIHRNDDVDGQGTEEGKIKVRERFGREDEVDRILHERGEALKLLERLEKLVGKGPR